MNDTAQQARRSSMEQLRGVHEVMERLLDPTEAPYDPDTLTVASLGAQIALVLAVQELTEAIRWPKAPITQLNDLDVEPIGWTSSLGGFIHDHDDQSERFMALHRDCLPLWTLKR